MNRIKEIREFCRMTQMELSTKAKISQPYLVDLENNRRGAKPETLQRIADAMGVQVADLYVEGVEQREKAAHRKGHPRAVRSA